MIATEKSLQVKLFKAFVEVGLAFERTHQGGGNSTSARRQGHPVKRRTIPVLLVLQDSNRQNRPQTSKNDVSDVLTKFGNILEQLGGHVHQNAFHDIDIWNPDGAAEEDIDQVSVVELVVQVFSSFFVSRSDSGAEVGPF